MNTKRITLTLSVILGIMAISTSAVFADSSWIWISETRPFDVLPFVAVGTIFIETVMICWLGKVGKKLLATGVVIVSNLVSFVVPYLLEMANDVHLGMDALESMPFYTVGFLYLLLTLVIEVPIGYIIMGKYVKDSRRLLIVLVAANAVTTAMVALVERTLCEGYWY